MLFLILTSKIVGPPARLFCIDDSEWTSLRAGRLHVRRMSSIARSDIGRTPKLGLIADTLRN
jgi:hypothetical protein